MKRKIIFNLAASIDGYIANEDGSYEWITGDGSKKLDTENKWDYNKFLENIDIVVMGRVCYEQNFHNDFKNKKVYVATSKYMKNYDNIHFINENIVDIILEEQMCE